MRTIPSIFLINCSVSRPRRQRVFRSVRMAWVLCPEWPRIQVQTERDIRGLVSTCPPLTANARWRLILRDDGYTDDHVSVYTPTRVRRVSSVLHVREQRQLRSDYARTEVSTETDTLLMQDLETDCLPPCAKRFIDEIPLASSLSLGVPQNSLPCVRTVRSIITDSKDTPLVYVTAWWDDRLFAHVSRSAGSHFLPSALSLQRYEHSRKILTVVHGECPQFANLDADGDGSVYVWGRNYVYKKKRCPFCVVHEVFSPNLEQYLGKMTPPL